MEQLAVLLLNGAAQRHPLPPGISQAEVFHDAHVRGGPLHRILKEAADIAGTFVLRLTRQIHAIQRDRAAVCAQRAADGIEQRALSRAVGAQHTDKLAPIEMQRHMIERLAFIDRPRMERHTDIIKIEHKVSSVSSRTAARSR